MRRWSSLHERSGDRASGRFSRAGRPEAVLCYIPTVQTIVECVPNFSEGRDLQKVNAIAQAILAGPDVHVLDQTMYADHNRSVITFVGSLDSVGEASLRAIGRAAELIDMNTHQGVHPRIGATDVAPFIPVTGARLEDCVAIARYVAAETWNRFRIPTYLYEAAAQTPERMRLENIRRGQFERLREAVLTDPDRRPDFGGPSLHPTAGATAVSARNFLIAYNINLSTPDTQVAKTIARKIRAASGGFPGVKAIGVKAKSRNMAQVSINLTDFETTPLRTVFDAVATEAAQAGVTIENSEIIGLVPSRALDGVDISHLKIRGFHPGMIFEYRLASVTGMVEATSSQSNNKA